MVSHHLTAPDHACIAQRARRDQVESQVRKRALETDACRHVEIEDEFLQGLLDRRIIEMVVTNKRRTVGVKRRPGLGSRTFTLRGEGGIDELAQKRAQMARRLGLYFSRDSAKTMNQDLPQIPAGAVGAKKAEVVDMDGSALMGIADFIGVDFMQPIVFCKSFANVVVQAVDRLLRVGILTDLPVAVIQVIGKHADGRPNQRI